MQKHEAVKQFDELRKDAAGAVTATALLVVQTTDSARQLTQQLNAMTQQTSSQHESHQCEARRL